MAVLQSQKEQRRSELARLSQDNLLRAVLLLAVPVIIEMALQSTVGIADVAMVGRLSPAAIAAVGLSNQVYMLALTVFAAVRTGTTVLVARMVGAGDLPGANKAARQSLLLSLWVALVLAAFGLLFPELGLRMLGAGEDVILVGVGYMRWKAVSVIFAILVMTATGILRGCGDTLTSMYANVTINLTNIALNWVFIFGNLGMPAMGAAGAGFATMVARAAGAVIMLYVLMRGKASIRIKLRDDNHIDWPILRRVLNVGLPAAMEELMMRGAQIFFTMIITSLGTFMYAAHQIALRAESLAFMPGMGFAVAATTLVGQNLGAQQPGIARRAGWLTMWLCIGMMSAIGVLLFVFAVPMVGFFTPEPEVVAAGARVLRIMALAMPFMAVARVGAGALRGAGDTKFVMWGTGLSIWAARLGLAFVFVKIFDLGLTGAWLGMCADQIARAMFFGIRYYSDKWQHIRV
ncbi:MAG: MATE family efflux transporter [Bacillota bacterium]